ncbi:Endonuclease/exonuclease/phosphatase [Cynara cardunculus var. scolymus]|uniref:Endonuclease/exonuclease/phosphatase n=1 Tax=Cynara cardunculus var. scolymus TaxID=59895 RepID=A0A103XQ01_CYNCS|nr:Endonuclease/exonuclease/phosphatase [Cynara cardunculus var. scolymus]
MLSVLRVHLPSDIPIVGCELLPYVLLRHPDKSVSSEDVRESSPIEGHILRYNIHPSEQATLQCLGCVKAKIPITKSYHCSPKCFSDAWQHHRVLHERAASAVNENGNEEEEIFGRFTNATAGVNTTTLSALQAATPLHPIALKNGGETWFEVGYAKTYTPTADDIGHILKFECVVIDLGTKTPVGNPNTILTARVIPAPTPSPRRLISVSNLDGSGNLDLDLDGRFSSVGSFTVLSYNILSDSYATSDLYSYCPSWALSWPYRRQNLLREIVGYRADIVCLQEVEFNKAAQSLTDALANSHVNVHQDLKDVKLWQVHTLLKGLEKIAAIDPLGILRPATKLTHALPLVSAYSSFARIGVGLGYDQQKRRVDPATNEPLFTNCTRDFIGTLDYIFYSADSLTVESLLELLDEDSLRKDTALPSPEWSSDHIALLAEFRCKPRTRR